MGLGFTEIILIFLVVLLFFGAKRLPEIARSLGKATSEFHRAKNEILSPPAPAGLETRIADAEVVSDEPAAGTVNEPAASVAEKSV